MITRFSLPAPNRFVRQITTFVRNGDTSWRRDDETHHNVLVDAVRLPALLAAEGVQAKVAVAFGTEQLPTGLRVLTGGAVRVGLLFPWSAPYPSVLSLATVSWKLQAPAGA
jgi:hypothetical protein